jgi:excisionase family DNA binding protein
MDERKLLTTLEACAYLSVGRTTLYQLAARGKLRRTRLLGAVRWSRVELDRLIAEGTKTPRGR